MSRRLVLLHSPLTSAAAWGGLPGELQALGYAVAAPDVADDVAAPFARRYVSSVVRQVGPLPGAVLVAHSGAGALLALVGAALREEGFDVQAYVLLDAALPPGTDATRLQLLRDESPAVADELERLLRGGGRFPDYGDALEDSALRATLRPRGLDYFEEPVEAVPGWPDAPVAYVQLSAGYDVVAHHARGYGWPVTRLLLGHFAAWQHPAVVAEVLDGVLR